MTEQTTSTRGGFDLGGAMGFLRGNVLTGQIGLAIGIGLILVVMIMPLPTWLLDFGLALSITFSVMILMTAIFIRKPLEFTSFPSILLISTLLRLSLNLSSTRLILTHGHEGPDAAGGIIAAFAGFVMSGNFIIGVTVFAILTLVNFVVITKGSGRIAEVSARFALDAMPGKQMAIDADLSAGLIDEAEARKRRSDLDDLSQFLGSMDGASKFVRGDAVAGLAITLINVLVGVIVAMWQQGMPFVQAADTFTKLTIGDGLVSQIPSLIVSVAAGIMTTKGTSEVDTDKQIFGQLSGHPAGLGLSSATLVLLSLLPGMPMLPFLALAGVTGYYAYKLPRMREEKVQQEAALLAIEQKPAPVAEEPISTALQIDLVRMELGYGLLPLINTEQGNRLTDQIRALRRQMATEMGFVMPSVRIQDNLQLPPNSYVIRVKEIEAGRGEIRPNMLLVMDPRGDQIQLPGEKTVEPTFGLPAMWVDNTYREEGLFKGYTVVDPPTVVVTHLTELVRDHMAELLSYAETQKLLDEMDKVHQKLVADIIPQHITIGGLQRVLQNLLSERVSIRDLPTILEGIAEASGYTRNISSITEHVRARLARQLSDANTGPSGFIPLLILSPEWEQAFAEALVGDGDDRQLSMSPSRLQQFMTTIRSNFEKFANMGESPVLLTSPGIRAYVRSIVERFRPQTIVMSQNEIHPKAKIKTLGQI